MIGDAVGEARPQGVELVGFDISGAEVGVILYGMCVVYFVFDFCICYVLVFYVFCVYVFVYVFFLLNCFVYYCCIIVIICDS